MEHIVILSKNSKVAAVVEDYLKGAGYTTETSQTMTAIRSGGFPTISLILFDTTDLRSKVQVSVSKLQIRVPLTPIITLVEQGNIPAAVQSLRGGAMDALAFPIDKTALLKSIQNAITQGESQQNQIILQQAIGLLQSLRAPISTTDSLPKEQLEETLDDDTHSEHVLQFEELVIDTDQEKAFYQERSIDLTPSQFKLLSELAKSFGRVVPFEELYFQLHGVHLDRAEARIALSAHMSYLRSKLVTVGCGEYLVNVRGRGYLLRFPGKGDFLTD